MAGLPQKQENIKLACELAWKAFAGGDPRAVAAKTGAEVQAEGILSLVVLGETYRVDRERREIIRPDGEALSDRLAALILHYLTRGDGAGLANREIGFSQIPGGAFYEGPFRKRIVSRIIRKFGNEPELLLKCGMDLGGRKTKYGDAAMRFDAFPRVPIAIVIWRGDEEFPANANFVFDASIANYLSLEDVVVACEELVNRLVKVGSAVSGESKK